MLEPSLPAPPLLPHQHLPAPALLVPTPPAAWDGMGWERCEQSGRGAALLVLPMGLGGLTQHLGAQQG